MAAVLWLAGLAAPESSGAEIDLGRIETEESRAETARHEEKLDPAKDGWNSEAFSDLARGNLENSRRSFPIPKN